MAALLLLPLLTSRIPSPFLATYFSAREARYPLTSLRRVGAEADCDSLKMQIAQRWGYQVFAKEGSCWVTTYR